MNKKFSTLVASLLLAGAWTTANADVVKVPLVIGGQYDWIGTAVDGNTVEDSWAAGAFTISDEPQSAVESDKFTLEAVTGTEGHFYVKSGDEYLSLASNRGDDAWLDWATGKTKALEFELKDGGLVLAKLATSTFKAGLPLVITEKGKVEIDYTTEGATPTKLVAAVWSDGVNVLNQNSMLQGEVNANEYYLIYDADESKYLLGDEDGNAELSDVAISAENLDYYLWQVSSEVVGDVTRYTFTNKATGEKAVKDGEYSFAADHAYAGGFTLTTIGSNELGIYKSPVIDLTVADLNAILYNGFGLTVKVKDGTTLTGAEAINGKLVAVGNDGDDVFCIMNGKKYVALTVANEWSIDNTGANERGGKFVLLSQEEYEKADMDKNYLTLFSINKYAGVADEVVNVITVANADRSVVKDMYVMKLDAETAILTGTKGIVEGESYPEITLEASNVADVEQFLGEFWNIAFAATKAEVSDDAYDSNGDDYKVGRVLAMEIDANETPEAEYVPASSVENGFPEAQWAVVAADLDNNSFTLANRESGVRISNIILREVADEENVYIVASAEAGANLKAGDKIRMTKVADPKASDGYANYTINALRNTTFYMGQYHAIEGNNNVYFSENHGDSHLLGVVTDKEGAATVWDLEYRMKTEDGKENEIDTVFVTTKFATVKDGEIVTTEKESKLAILPFQFKNRANGEYVAYNSLKGYECYTLGDNDEVNGYEKPGAASFALKMQPDGTYNIVEITSIGSDGNYYALQSKIQVANSEIDGFGKLVKYGMYEEDNNSLMVVEARETPEYHKVAEEWGDVVRIFRADNESQVVYEHHDDKCVVENDTLSFLTTANIEQFTDINPAMFVDTAFVNRTINGEANTCYQYLLAVNVDKVLDTYCPENPLHNDEAWIEANGVCPHAIKTPVVHARYLVNLIDTANNYTEIHNNPYITENVTGEKLAKLSFVKGFHIADSLYFVRQGGDTVKYELGTPEFNPVKFAFRYVDVAEKSFKIQTMWKQFNINLDEEDLETSQEGYLKWINGVLAVEKDWKNGDVFSINEDETLTPTANESVEEAIEGVTVIAGNGTVTIQGAAGKQVIVSNILGKVVANTVLTSDNATISVPAGIVAVAVEGEEAVKAIVK